MEIRNKVLTVVLATDNPNKAREIKEILSDMDFVNRPSNFPEIEEIGETLKDNAVLKAEAISAFTNLPALADDTGFEVEALDFAPGVFSARFAGKDSTDADNVNKVLKLTENETNRTAYFKTVIALAVDGKERVVGYGVIKGKITTEVRGTNGFGYDGIFIPDGSDGRTFGQMSKEEKNSMSHRRLALLDFKQKFLSDMLSGS